MPFNRKSVNSNPNVWHTFQRINDEGKVRNFRVQDVCETDKIQVLEIALKSFLIDEPTIKLKDFINDRKSFDEIKKYWEDALKENTSLVCYEVMADGCCKIAGFNVLKVSCKEAEERENDVLEKIEGEGWKQVLKLLIYTSKSVDLFNRYNTDKYLSGCGLFVLRENRGLKIGGEILKAREPLCKALDIKATVTIFTSIASQRLATHCGYEFLKEIPYNSQELLQQGMDFRGITEVPSCKLLGIKFIA